MLRFPVSDDLRTSPDRVIAACVGDVQLNPEILMSSALVQVRSSA